MTFESYIETAESTGERSQATEEIPDNARWDRRNRSFDHIDPRICVQSLTILSQSKLGIPKKKKKITSIIEFNLYRPLYKSLSTSMVR